MVRMYSKNWSKSILTALAWHVRDSIIYYLPIRKVPKFLVRLLYGYEPKFFFLVHPRRYQDVFVGVPFLRLLKFFFRKETAYKIISELPPFILSRVTSRSSVDGVVVGYLIMPELMMSNQKWALKKAKNMIRFCGKITSSGGVVGLGGWWPMFTRRGLALESDAKKWGLKITSGHCGTLLSIYLTIKKIAKLTALALDRMSIAIIGTGKMGANVARALYGEIGSLLLIDINETKLERLCGELQGKSTKIRKVCLGNYSGRVYDLLKGYQVGVCATSNARNLFKLRDLPDGLIIIDDSRPEAFPRDPRQRKIVLEGGLCKIKGVSIDYDYGFGMDENLFGCLTEAYMLALDGGATLEVTTGDVDRNNFIRMVNFCLSNNIEAGDFKSSSEIVSDQKIKEAISVSLSKRNNNTASDECSKN